MLTAGLAGGCGDDETRAGAETSTATTPRTSTQADQQGQRQSPEAAKHKRRLERSGFDEVIESRTAGVPGLQGAVEMPFEGGGGLTIYLYGSEEEAEAKAAEFRPMARKYPEYAQVVRHGPRVYLGIAESPDTLDVPAFERAVAVSENP